jgi:hypothetical protein
VARVMYVESAIRFCNSLLAERAYAAQDHVTICFWYVADLADMHMYWHASPIFSRSTLVNALNACLPSAYLHGRWWNSRGCVCVCLHVVVVVAS